MKNQARSAFGRRGRTFPDRLRAGIVAALGLPLFLTVAGLPAVPLAGAATESPVAIVGTEEITGSEYRDYLRVYVRSQLYHGGSPERLRELADEALANMVSERILLIEARRRGIAGDEAAVTARIDALKAQYSESENWPEVEKQLPAIAERLLSQSRVEALKAEVSDVAPPTEAELEAFHAANLELFTEPAAWDLGLVLIGVSPSSLAAELMEAKARAEAVVASVRGGADFAEAARAESAHQSASEGGQLGRVHEGQLPPDAQSAIEDLAPGEITDPIRVLEGFAIFRFNGRIPPIVHPLSEVRERAEGLYLRNTAAERWEALVAGLRTDTPVELFDIAGQIEKVMKGE
ncbi:MAG TPA: peptidylprolyl isomerase [Thermohalobaculum sp.]|nr:peptidylprolyl isomerase [Thermohalobaculum sp.]